MMRMNLCCCTNESDPCFVCQFSERPNLQNISISFPSQIQTGISAASATVGDSYTTFDTVLGASGVSTWSITQQQFVSPEIPSSVSVRRRGLTPDRILETGLGYDPSVGGICQWLWNDVRSSHWVTHYSSYNDGDPRIVYQMPPYYIPGLTFTPAIMENVLNYIPVNQYDSSSPWNRVGVEPSDPRIGTCYLTPITTCQSTYRWIGNGSTVFSSVLLSIKNLDWFVTVRSEVERSQFLSGVNVYDAGVFSPAHSRQFSVPVTPKTQGIHPIEFGGWNNYTHGTTPPMFAHQPLASASPYAIATAVYSKPVACELDFNGEPIILPFRYHIFSGNSNSEFQFASLPSSVEVRLNGL